MATVMTEVLLPGGYRPHLSDTATLRSTYKRHVHKQVDEAASIVPAQETLSQSPDVGAMRRAEVRIHLVSTNQPVPCKSTTAHP